MGASLGQRSRVLPSLFVFVQTLIISIAIQSWYKFAEFPANECVREKFTVIGLRLTLSRKSRHYFLHVYIPSGLVVVASWISFYLPPDSVPARTSLGIVTILTMTTQFSNEEVQHGFYMRAIDIWVTACMILLFLAMLEFTLVNQLHNRCKDDIKEPQMRQAVQGEEDISKKIGHAIPNSAYENDEESASEVNINKTKTFGMKGIDVKIDKVARVVFPVVFVVFNIIYWPYYLLTQQHTQTWDA